MSKSVHHNLNGLILAGGKSTRMGFDKALLNFHGGPQVVWLNSLLQNFCNQVFVSGSPEKLSYPLNFIEDHYTTGGPMNGILSAFKQASAVSWLVVPVDMPNVNDDVITYLLTNCDNTKVATCFKNPAGRNEPLPAILKPAAYPILLNRFLGGDESLNQFLNDEGVAISAPDAKWLVNVNTPSLPEN